MSEPVPWMSKHQVEEMDSLYTELRIERDILTEQRDLARSIAEASQAEVAALKTELDLVTRRERAIRDLLDMGTDEHLARIVRLEAALQPFAAAVSKGRPHKVRASAYAHARKLLEPPTQHQGGS